MAIRKINEIMESLKAKFGEDSDDTTLSLLEDVTDTLNDYDNRTKDSTNWEQKYNQLDADWRQKYRDRFYSSEPNPEEPDPFNPEPKKTLSFEELFKEE